MILIKQLLLYKICNLISILHPKLTCQECGAWASLPHINLDANLRRDASLTQKSIKSAFAAFCIAQQMGCKSERVHPPPREPPRQGYAPSSASASGSSRTVSMRRRTGGGGGVVVDGSGDGGRVERGRRRGQSVGGRHGVERAQQFRPLRPAEQRWQHAFAAALRSA